MYAMHILMIFTLVACSTGPSNYGALKKKQGWADETIGNDLRMASFQGNSATKKEAAELYAKFRAIEVCHEIGTPNTHILKIKDKSYSKEIVSSTSTTPSYYYGMSPYYGGIRGVNPGMGVGYSVGSTSTRSDTYNYPLFEVYFECVANPKDARLSFIELSGSQMKDLVKDLQGAIQVEEVLDDSPNRGKLQKGDIIVKARGERVTSLVEGFHTARKNMDQKLNVEFFRDGVKKQAVVSFADVTQHVQEAQNEIIKSGCKEESVQASSPLCKK